MSKKDLNIKEFLNIRLVLDRSGSMASCKEITIDSINSFLEEQRKNNIDGALTISLFDNRSIDVPINCLLYTSPSPRDKRQSRMPSSA